MDIKKGQLTVITLSVLMLTLTGCGNTNFFKSLVGDPRPSAANPAAALADIQRNNNSGNYAASIPIAESVINSTTATTVEKIDAYELKGVSILGNAGFESLVLAQTLLDASENVSSNILNTFPEIPVADAISAATALNQAATLASSNSTTLDKDAQVSRGLANTSVIVSRVNDAFVIDKNGNATPVTGSTNKQALATLLRGDSTGKTIVDYATNAGDSLSKASVLSDKQKTEADKVKDIPAQLKLLNAAVNEQNGAAYVYTNSNNQVITINASSPEPAVQAAANHIFKQAN